MQYILAALIFAPLILFLVNRHLFSWAGLILRAIPTPFGCSFCDYKSIGVPVDNGHPKILSFVVDSTKIARALHANPNYYLINFGYRITVYRKYGKVWYWLSLYTYSNNYRSVTEMSLGAGTPLPKRREGEPSVDGESFITPSGWIKNRIFRIINDLPLPPIQKTEMKKHVRIQCIGNSQSFF